MPNKKELTSDEKKHEGDIWLNRIINSRNYENVYRRQAYASYKFYNRNYNDVYVYEDVPAKFKDVDERIEKFTSKNNRSNIYYANIETLLALVLPQIPSIKVYLNNSRDYEPTKANQFYDLAIGVLEDVSNYFIKKSLTKDTFKKFKLDHFITGRGVLWVDHYEIADEKTGTRKMVVSIDNVSWLNFAYDPKLTWEEVRWVARRQYLNKAKLQTLYPEGDFEDFNFTSNPYINLQGDDVYPEIDTTYLASGGKYAEVWEIWDKFTKKKIVVSPQAADKIIGLEEVVNVPDEMFFPTAQPPLTIKNGLDLRPTAELWNYFHELRQLNFISLRKEQLLRSLMLKGFISAANSDAIQRINNARDGDIVAIQSFDPEHPEVIYYVDNKPKVEMLQILTQEHNALKDAIYEISGISDQMRNVAAQSDSASDEQSATEIKTKTLFGSRRLREKQDIIAQYLCKIYEIIIFRICNSANVETLQEITNLNIPFSNADEIQALMQQKQQIQMQQSSQGGFAQPTTLGGASLRGMQPQQPQPPQTQQGAEPPNEQFSNGMSGEQGQEDNNQEPMAQQQQQMQGQPDMQAQGQNPQQAAMQQQQQQIQQQLSQIENRLQELRDAPTWEGLMRFFSTQALSQIAIEVDLDDLNNLMGKNQLSQESFAASSQLMQTMTNVAQMAMQQPEFVDVFCNLLEGNCDTSLYSLSQKRQIRDFTSALKAKVKQMQANPQPQPPNPEAIKAQAAQMTAQARMQEAQGESAWALAKGQLAQVEAQEKMQEMQREAGAASEDLQKGMAKQQELNTKHRQEIEKLQMDIEAANVRAKDKLQTDTNLMQMKIQADDKRYQDKIKSDIIKEKMKNAAKQPVFTEEEF
ncbi:hypothetical protein [Candidatus Endomicrobiellum devescovinae]|jgi:hypothetical protein|uniref:hypothetical protein n=1 Tax=Candidatus Endomicrobiellum devescovinae TaxID=3242322 RepID=UPI00282612CF|nr:hypothetical protein [Endomicrobium sp.]